MKGLAQRVGGVRLGRRAALVLLLAAGVLLRAHDLGSPPLWVDEAESSINALTIVADGVPGDRFLGQPIYENTLVRQWPESPEYEFRDMSYSDKGLAVYHGWLPLYAIAGAFVLAGVTPEEARTGTPPRDASPAEIYRWTAVPRLPALAFSAIFIAAAWWLGRRVDGPSVGWALGVTAAASQMFVEFGRQARYYSATLAGGAACGLAVWNACRRGRLSDHALAGLGVGLLFHIHALSGVTMAVVYVATLPLARGQPRLLLRVLAAGSVGGLLVLPWAAWSGFLAQAVRIPPARDYLDLPGLLRSVPSSDPVVLAIAALGIGGYALALLGGGRVPERWRAPFLERADAFYFATAWLALSYLAFVALIPAPSYFIDRLKLAVAVPGLLVNTLAVFALSRAVRPASRLLPVAGMAGLLFLSGLAPPSLPLGPGDDRAFSELIASVRSWRIADAGRIFASPNEHLVLTYYTGRPVQSIAPVRKEWLDRFAGDLVVVDGARFANLKLADVQAAARRLRRTLPPGEAERRAVRAPVLATALDLAASGVPGAPRLPPIDDLDRALVAAVREGTRENIGRMMRGNPLERIAAPSNWDEFRRDFFYWFSDPGRRSGAGLNWSACRARARVHLLARRHVLFDCRKEPYPPLVADTAVLGRAP